MKHLRPLLHALLLVLAVVTLSPRADAIPFAIHDRVALLDSIERTTLWETASTWPFDTVVLIEDLDKTALQAKAVSLVSAPEIVVIAISPAKRATVVRFGSGAGVEEGKWAGIAKAGNGAFKEGKWRAGIEAIGFKAKAAVEEARAALRPTTHAPVVPQIPQPVLIAHDTTTPTSAWVAIGSCIAFFAGLIAWMVRKHNQKTQELKDAADKLTYEAADIASKTITLEERRERGKWEEVES